jgi:hypothetical protein
VRTFRRGVFVALTITSFTLIGAAPALAGAVPAPSEQCSIEIVGLNEDGSYDTGPLVCDTGPTVAAELAGYSATSVIATHYEGYNFSGASLSISGGSCNGGWLNLPPGWRNRIASTVSGCTTRHYAQLDKGGAVNTTFNPGGNLTSVAFNAESVRYG